MFTSVKSDSTMQGDVGLKGDEETPGIHVHTSGSVVFLCRDQRVHVHTLRQSDRLICSATTLQHHLQDPTRSHSMSIADYMCTDHVANNLHGCYFYAFSSDECEQRTAQKQPPTGDAEHANSRICCVSFHVPIFLMRYTAICTLPKKNLLP
jgi:hypothetical protein